MKKFPQFVVIHTVKGFSIVHEAEVDIFLEFSCFFYDPMDVGNLISVPLPFLNSAWTSGYSQFMCCWSLAWRILSMTLLSKWDEFNCTIVWTFFGTALLWDWNENWPFLVLWPLLSFPDLLTYWVQHYSLVMVKGLHNLGSLCRTTQVGQVIVKSSDKTWSTGGGNDKPL